MLESGDQSQSIAGNLPGTAPQADHSAGRGACEWHCSDAREAPLRTSSDVALAAVRTLGEPPR